MLKRILLCLICIALALPQSGCWNYRSLDQLDLVVGIAVDYDDSNKEFTVGYEIANLQATGKNQPVKGKVITAKGKTIFECTRNAKKKNADRLFFGSANILVLSKNAIDNHGIIDTIEWFIRDGECRETMFVTISKENTAADILKTTEGTTDIVSQTMQQIISEDKKNTGSANSIQLYELYNDLKSKRKSEVLAAFRIPKDEKNKTPELDGSAVIRDGKLAGFISAEESKYYLLVENKLKGGVIPLSTDGSDMNDISLEIFETKTKKTFEKKDGVITFKVETKLEVAIGENQKELDMQDPKVIKKIEEEASKKVEEEIKRLMYVVQNQFDADVFGVGELIYKRDLKLWKGIAKDWDETYPTIKLDVKCKVHVRNSGFTK